MIASSLRGARRKRPCPSQVRSPLATQGMNPSLTNFARGFFRFGPVARLDVIKHGNGHLEFILRAVQLVQEPRPVFLLRRRMLAGNRIEAVKKRFGNHTIRILTGTVQHFEPPIENELAPREAALYLRKQRDQSCLLFFALFAFASLRSDSCRRYREKTRDSRPATGGRNAAPADIRARRDRSYPSPGYSTPGLTPIDHFVLIRGISSLLRAISPNET